MRDENETPESSRERMRQEELKRNPAGNLNDSFQRAQTGGLADLVGGLGWKGSGILILVLIIVGILAAIFLN
ncbi:DUF6366 family protein [Aureibacillus halotolerans]|uniref:Phage capsid protein n=1 Tax=Aureibacillus halotolerans TaxID=1508390 RepID=A0A4R6TSY8_9BACI|nr:DUF6366 family protein [Aureibacillus halotolerans]TDQ34611.1 hypothetical protein EV213_12429 [Aureibacillus halotolerans]